MIDNLLIKISNYKNEIEDLKTKQTVTSESEIKEIPSEIVTQNEGDLSEVGSSNVSSVVFTQDDNDGSPTSEYGSLLEPKEDTETKQTVTSKSEIKEIPSEIVTRNEGDLPEVGSSDVSSAVFTPPIGSSTSEPEAVSANEPLSVDESLLEPLKDTETKQTTTSESDNLDVFTQDDNVGSPTSEDGSLLEPKKEYTDISGPDSSVLYTQRWQ